MTVRSCIALILACAAAGIGAGCGTSVPAPDTRASDESAIRELDIAMAKASEGRQVDAMVEHYTDDAIMYAPGAPPIKGKAAIRQGLVKMFEAPTTTLTWKPEKVDVARSGDLAYSRGTYVFHEVNAAGKTVQEHGSYLVVWRKQAGGQWKAVEDMAVSEGTPAPAAGAE